MTLGAHTQDLIVSLLGTAEYLWSKSSQDRDQLEVPKSCPMRNSVHKILRLEDAAILMALGDVN